MQRSLSGLALTELSKSLSMPLTKLPQPVKELFVVGDLEMLLNKPCVAIVGSRKVSEYGRSVTRQIASELARAGVVIISGLALGVDSIAHKAALDAGGHTIAVLPCGLDYIYPALHYGLSRDILSQGGALVSEYATGKGGPMKHQFIARNRIIATLSQAVIIPEAAQKSGSLHTANFALEQGIEVFAVPGDITSPNSAGTNQLIKDGAFCLTSSKDILELFNIQISDKPLPDLNPQELLVYTALKENNLTLAELILATSLSIEILLQTLSILEISGHITKHGDTFSLPSSDHV